MIEPQNTESVFESSIFDMLKLAASILFYDPRFAFPHDEIALGGCLAAGRGGLHINAYRDVEPCPFSHCSDRNLNEVSLLEAIQSPLLRLLREFDISLDESNGRCTLWTPRVWVSSLLVRSKRGPRIDGKQMDMLNGVLTSDVAEFSSLAEPVHVGDA